VSAVAKRPYDAVVVGGGINGCGVARDLALRGLSVALVERRDLGSGTSGHSSGMIHGGPRYLMREREVTRASCVDAGRIRAAAPHLCFRIPFLVPILRGTPRLQVEALEAYFEAYDMFAPLKDGRRHTRLSEDEARRVEPGLGSRVAGAVTFDEWGVDGVRLCLANALDARRHGADVFTYAPVVRLVRDGPRVCGVVAATRDGERHLEAPVVVNVAGPWAPEVASLAGVPLRLRRGKGVHLVFGRRLGNFGIMSRAVDGRWVLLEPHQNGALLGTTDDDSYAGADDLTVSKDEVEYLLEGIAHVFPSVRDHRFLRTVLGVRPTLFAWGPTPDELSREHAILDHEADGAPGLITMVGGKLATYRAMCEELADAVGRRLGSRAACRTHVEPLPGAGACDAGRLAERFRIPPAAAVRLTFRHGAEAGEVLEAVDARERGVLCTCEPVLRAEALHALRAEQATSIDDLRRRTRMGEGACQGAGCIGRACALLFDAGVAPVEGAHRSALHALRERWRGRVVAMDQPGSATLAAEEVAQSRYFLVGDYARLPWA
jgi:glycerol-3-phosphate dehydrogenase